MQIPTREPSAFIAGDTVKWLKDLPDYLPSDGWVLSYTLVMDGDKQTVTATDNSDGRHLVVIGAAASVLYVSGIYSWQASVTKNDERYTVAGGVIEVQSNFAGAADGFDDRSHVKKVLDALEAMLLGKASRDQMSVSVNGRSVSSMSVPDLLMWRDKYKAEYAREIAAKDIANGVGGQKKILVRF